MLFFLWKNHQKSNGLTPSRVKGYVSADSIEDARAKLKLSFTLSRVVQNRQVVGYKKTEKHKTVYYLAEANGLVSGEDITSI
ncbi:hypothetical protein L6270_03960 [Candidatus Parcubacteria bacterium]|nr:hypothetical protein [Patescibacteria group bacterium]MBU4309119.1 hypothetical protein [Patescibacteria group bacterium]MBU4432715.1 hypothetical protein [Patescibacteria group bacterium]MBU4577480.1 hypothetical protein [Patescibacteria group bacterium]MCG2697168.1 hypothetical protein [Candidatus Parcubacteria bacterium]